MRSLWPKQRLIVSELKEFIEYHGDRLPPVAIIAGIRRIGKTTVLKQLQEIYPHSLYINFRDNTWTPVDYAPESATAEEVLDKFKNSRNTELLLLDEITSLRGYEQECEELYGFAGGVGRWRYKVVITGSSPAHLFKLNHLTLGGGRSKVMNLPVLSFVEYLYFTGRIQSYDAYEHVTIDDFKDYLVLKGLDSALAVSFDAQYFISHYEENTVSNENRRASRAFMPLARDDLMVMANLLAYQLSEHVKYSTAMNPAVGERELKQLATNAGDLREMSLSLSDTLLAKSVAIVRPIDPEGRARLIKFLLESRIVNCSTLLLSDAERPMDASAVLYELESTTNTEYLNKLFNKVSISVSSPLLYTRLGEDILERFGLNLEYLLSGNEHNALLGKILEVYVRGAITQQHCAVLPYITAKVNYAGIGEVDIWDEETGLLCEVTAGKEKRPSDVRVGRYFKERQLLRVCTTRELGGGGQEYYRIPYPQLCCMIDMGDVFTLPQTYGEGFLR